MPKRSRAKRKPIFVLGIHMRAPDTPVHVGLHLESRVRTLSVLQSALRCLPGALCGTPIIVSLFGVSRPSCPCPNGITRGPRSTRIRK